MKLIKSISSWIFGMARARTIVPALLGASASGASLGKKRTNRSKEALA